MNPRHNLPKKTHPRLVGREDTLREVMARLAPTSPDWVVPLIGEAGVGKTALALEVAYQCVAGARDAPQFDAVMWVAVAPRESTATSLTSAKAPPALDNVLAVIAQVLNARDVLRVPRKRQTQIARHGIKEHEPVLLIVDGLDMADDLELLRFLMYDIPRDNPSRRSKVLATLHYTGELPRPITLAPLTVEQTVELMLVESGMRDMPMDRDTATTLGKLTCGMPLAARWAVGCFHEYGLDDTVRWLQQSTNISSAFLREITHHLQQSDDDSFRVLLALACFDMQTGVANDMLAFVSGIDARPHHAALRRLEDLGVVILPSTASQRRQRIALLPFAHRYFRQQAHDQGEWVMAVYERAFAFVRRIVEPVDAHAGYDELRPEVLNVIEVMRWLMSQRRLTELAWLFQRVADLLFAEAHWNALIECTQVLAQWAVAARDVETLRVVLHQPIDICARRNELATGNYWIDLARELVERQVDPLLSAEVPLARARLRYGNGNGYSISSVEQPSADTSRAETYQLVRELERSLATFVERDLQLSVVQALNTLGLVLRSQMDHDAAALPQARAYYEQALAMIECNAPTYPDFTTWRPIILSNLAIIAGREGHYAQACAELRPLLSNLLEVSEKAQANAVLAYYYYLLGDTKQAHQYRTRAEDLKRGLDLGDTYLCREDRLWDREILPRL